MRTNSRTTVGSPTVRVMAIMAATLLLIVATAAAGAGVQRLLAADGEIVVDRSGNGDFTTITEAVAAAVDGDRILVRPGTYGERVDVDKNVSISGAGNRGEVVLAPPDDGGSAYGLRLANTEATVRDIDVSAPQSSPAIVIDGGAPTLERVTVLAGPQTSLLLERGDAVLRDVDLHGRTVVRGSAPQFLDSRLWCGATVSTDATFLRTAFLDGPECPRWFAADEYGIQVESASPSFLASSVEMPGDVLEVYGVGSEPIIEGTTFTGAATAVGTFQGARPQIRDSVFTGNDVAMSLMGSAIVEGNTVSGGGVGVNVREGAPTLAGNDISGDGWAVSVEGTASPTLRDNVLCGFEASVFVADTAAADIDESNTICDGGSD